MTFRRKLWGLATASLAVLAIPTTASAETTTVGETFEPFPGLTCFADITRLQFESPGDQYEVPFDGVITSWSYRTNATSPELKFKVARPVAPLTFTVVGESPLVTTEPNQLNTYPVNIPVQAGDVIGTFMATDGDCARDDPLYSFARKSGDVQPGETETFLSTPNFQLDISAEVEPAEVEPSRCRGEDATIVGTEGADILEGTTGDDVIAAFGGNDRVRSFAGNDIVCGRRGKDVLRGASGDDVLRGGKTKDRLVGGVGRDKCAGNKGDDVAKKCEVEKSV